MLRQKPVVAIGRHTHQVAELADLHLAGLDEPADLSSDDIGGVEGRAIGYLDVGEVDRVGVALFARVW